MGAKHRCFWKRQHAPQVLGGVGGAYRAILSLQDMVSSRSPCSTPSHVWMLAFERTGIVPSPDSIFVRSCPRALRFGCLSAGSRTET